MRALLKAVVVLFVAVGWFYIAVAAGGDTHFMAGPFDTVATCEAFHSAIAQNDAMLGVSAECDHVDLSVVRVP